MKAGTFLKATHLLNGDFFEDALVFITEFNENGAMGFVVNQPFPRKLNELQEYVHSIPFPLHDGGPVDREHLFFLHRRPDLIEEGEALGNGIYLGGNFTEAVRCIDLGMIGEQDVKMFIGYCGWDADDLEAEIREGSWEEVEAMLFP